MTPKNKGWISTFLHDYATGALKIPGKAAKAGKGHFNAMRAGKGFQTTAQRTIC
jgi:hypothetical protein